MWKPIRTFLEFTVSVVGAVLIGYFIPSFYKVEQSYVIIKHSEASRIEPSFLVDIIHDWGKKQGESKEITNLSCKLNGKGKDLSCLLQVNRLSFAKKALAYLNKALPDRFGRILPSELERRIQTNARFISRWQNEYDYRYNQYQNKDENIVEEKQALELAVKSLQTLEQEHARRVQQLKLISEALSDPKPRKNVEIFKAKKNELTSSIADLKEKLSVASEEVARTSLPIEERKNTEERLALLSRSIDDAHIQIALWSSALPATPTVNPIPDPDNFRVGPISKTAWISPIRSSAHLRWSIPIGLLLFLLIKGYQYLWKQNGTFRTAQEVTEETGLRLIGTVRLG